MRHLTLRWPRRLMILPLLGLAVGACSDDDSSSTPTPVAPATLQVGPAGGSFELASGVTIRIPAGAVDQTVEVGVDIADASAGVTDEYRAGQIYTFTPAGLELAVPAEITIPNAGSGDGLLVVTVGASGGIESLKRGVAAGGTARGALERLGPVWVTQRGDVVATLSFLVSGYNLRAGDVVSLNVEALNLAGGRLNPDAVEFTSDQPDVVEVDATGARPTLRALAAGEATITATADGVSASLVVTVEASGVAQLQVLPADADLARRDTLQLTVRSFDAEGNETELPGDLRWSSSDRSVARVDANGLVVTYNSGEAEIVASGGGISGSATVRVEAPIPTSISIWPERPSVGMGQTRQLSARLLDEFGAMIEGADPEVTWQSSDESIATVDAEGHVTGVELGEAQIVATSAIEGVTADTVTLVVGSGRPDGLQILTQPEGGAPGSPFEVQPVIQLVDAFGNAVMRAGITIQARLVGGQGGLVGTQEVETDEQGVATFTDLGPDEGGTFRVEFSGRNLDSATSDEIEALLPMVMAFESVPLRQKPQGVNAAYASPNRVGSVVGEVLGTITLPFRGEFSITVDWGDGSDPESFKTGDTVSHDYAETSQAKVQVNGSAESFGVAQPWINPWAGVNKLAAVLQWGALGLESLQGAFGQAVRLSHVAEDFPETVTNTSYMFFGASNFEGLAVVDLGITGWDVSGVTNMKEMFKGASSFRGDISAWDVSSVTDMSGMFDGAIAFNQPIGGWDVSSVTTMKNMFYLSIEGDFTGSTFNQDIGEWDVSNVTDMSYMFYVEVNNDDTTAGNMTDVTTFNQDIGDWDVSNVTTMEGMFGVSAWSGGMTNVQTFNQDIGDWDVSNVTNMGYMFYVYADDDTNNVTTFNQPIGDWVVSKVESMDQMFSVDSDNDAEGVTAFNQPIGDWDVSSVKTMKGMFRGTDFNQDISKWVVSSVTTMEAMFEKTPFNQAIGSWDVSSVISMEDMFYKAASFNQKVSDWDVSSVTTMAYLFQEATAFNNGCGVGETTCPLLWTSDGQETVATSRTGNVFDMSNMFEETTFNQRIGHWDVSNVRSMGSMFEGASVFNQDISGWRTGSVERMADMFKEAKAFNQPLATNPATGAWDVSKVDDMDEMFREAEAFNQPLATWNVSNVEDMEEMFMDAKAFNQDISGWNVSNVEDCLDFDKRANAWVGYGNKDISGRDADDDEWGRPGDLGGC